MCDGKIVLAFLCDGSVNDRANILNFIQCECVCMDASNFL